MASTSHTYGDAGDDGSPIRRLRLFFGHYSGTLVAWLYLIFSVDVVFSAWFTGVGRAINTPFTVAFVSIAAITIWGDTLHKKTMCTREADDIDHVLDPEAATTKYDRRLRTVHWARLTRRTRHIVLASAVVIVLAIYGMQHLWPLAANILSTILLAGLAPFVFYLDFARMTHRRLQPWCRYCRRRGKDDDKPTPAPTPDPVGQNTL